MSTSQYKRMSEVEHVLKRSGIYLGSIFNTTREAYVLENDKMVPKEVNINPGLIKLFDEIISNAADESVRSGNVKNIWVDIHDNGSVSVKDDGGIPVELHEEYGIYIPEMIFSELRTGSNFDDENRTTAGLNGMGSVLTNIFSKHFIVETCDGKHYFYQKYFDNMSSRTNPLIKPSKKNGTTITFLPDYERLGCRLDKDALAMIEKRCYDIAAVFSNVKVFFQGERIKLKSFNDYVKMFADDSDIITESQNHWDIAVTSSLSDDSFRHVSFVNGIDTYNGGTHVDFVSNQIVSAVREFIRKKHKIDVKPNTIKQCLFIFVNCTINAPLFTSQTKEQLVNDSKSFDNPIIISQKTIKKIVESEIVQKVLDWVESQKRKQELAELRRLNKTSQKASLKHILKFEDAPTKNREDAILVFAEGDSAAATIKAARKSNPNIGVFALRGKVLNVRKAKYQKILENEEIKNILSVTGLKLGEKPVISDLYFQKFLIASDADYDGAHIAGLLMNMFGELWKEVLLNGLVYRLTTPVITANISKKEYEFFTLHDYEKWAEKNPKHSNLKYYKGLGSWSTDLFTKFLEDEKYHAQIKTSAEDLELIDMIFNSDRANDRKEWLKD